jgi:hypothetical protein
MFGGNNLRLFNPAFRTYWVKIFRSFGAFAFYKPERLKYINLGQRPKQ